MSEELTETPTAASDDALTREIATALSEPNVALIRKIIAVIGPAPYTNGPPAILPLTGVGTGNTVLTWSSVNSFNYRALYADTLAGPWLPLTADLYATNTTTSVIDPTPGVTQRFYQVLVVLP